MILQLLSALAQTLVLLTSRQLASCMQTVLHQEVHLLGALAQTVLLQSRSRPASYLPVSLNQSINEPSLQQGALVQTLLLLEASRPASITLTLTDLPGCLLKGPVLPSLTLLSPTNLSPTDLSVLSLPDPAHLLYRKLPEGTVLLALSRKRKVIFQTGLW